MIHDEIVDAYIRDCREEAQKELEYFRRANSLRDAISRATEKRSTHQYRIPNPLLKEAEIRLLRASDIIRAAGDFERLHDAVEKLIGNLRGVGELCVYDIAHRIATFRNLEPKLIYLHRGTRDGAKALGFKGKTLDPDKLPAAFSRLKPAEIEDCLCIYKVALTKGGLLAGVPRYARRCGPMHKRLQRVC